MRISTCLALLLAVIVVGCATTPPIDWNARVGHYTRDQAITELGPPDREAPLSDGTKVAEWMVQRGSTRMFVSPSDVWWTPHGYVRSGGYADSVTWPDQLLRLTFAPDGMLKEWKRLSR